MENLVIRLATEEDIERLAFIDKQCFDDPWSLKSFKEDVVENDIAYYFVGEINKEIVGYVGVWYIYGEGHITNVAVLPEFRKNKIAQKIIEKMLDYSQRRDVRDFTLEVRVSNIAAQNLYKKYNFKEAGIRPRYYSNNNEDALIMWRNH